MLFKLIATVFLAVGTAGLVLLLNKLLRNSLPKWAMPAAVALAIIGYQVFDDYNWASRKFSGLQQSEGEYVIVGEFEAKSALKPWRYFKPAITRIDTVNIKNNISFAGGSGVFENVIGTARQYGKATILPFVFDCENAQYSPKIGEASDLQWGPMTQKMFEGLCQ